MKKTVNIQSMNISENKFNEKIIDLLKRITEFE